MPRQWDGPLLRARFNHPVTRVGLWIQGKMMRAVLQVAVLAAAASCVFAEKGDLYGKDGKEKGSIVEQVRRSGVTRRVRSQPAAFRSARV